MNYDWDIKGTENNIKRFIKQKYIENKDGKNSIRISNQYICYTDKNSSIPTSARRYGVEYTPSFSVRCFEGIEVLFAHKEPNPTNLDFANNLIEKARKEKIDRMYDLLEDLASVRNLPISIELLLKNSGKNHEYEINIQDIAEELCDPDNEYRLNGPTRIREEIIEPILETIPISCMSVEELFNIHYNFYECSGQYDAYLITNKEKELTFLNKHLELKGVVSNIPFKNVNLIYGSGINLDKF